MNKRYIIPVFIPHKGCPHDCVFCNQKKISGCEGKWDLNVIDNTINEHLKSLKQPSKKMVQVAFYGGSFTAIPIKQQTNMLEFVQKYIQQKKIDSIRLSTRPDYIDDTILKNLKKYNVRTIELGVQSLSDKVLQLSGRGHTAQVVYSAVSKIKDYGFELGLQMMTGLPGDRGSESIFTALEIAKLKPDFVRIYPTLIVKNTALERLYLSGEYNALDLHTTIQLCKDILLIFKANSIQVIRIGLQTTENINLNADVAAGPFHPSIGELVQSELIYDLFCKLFSDNVVYGLDYIRVDVNPINISKFIGNKGINKYRFINNFNIKKLVINQDRNLNKYQYKVYFMNKTIKVNIDDIINRLYNQRYSMLSNYARQIAEHPFEE